MRRLSFCFCLLVGCTFFWSASAFAKEVHIFRSTFGSVGSGVGQFNKPSGIAVNDTTHDVYVVDSGNNRVEEFDSAGIPVGEFNGSGAPTGSFLEPSQIAVDNSTNPLDSSKEDVYIVDSAHGVVDKFSASGTYLAQLTGSDTQGGAFQPGEVLPRSIEGVAVDPSGTVWVDVYQGSVASFSNALQSPNVSEVKTDFGGLGEGLGVDSEDHLYLHESGFEFAKVNDLGQTLIAVFGGDKHAFGTTVDPLGGEVYLDNLETIEAFSLSGAPIEDFGSGHLTFSKGVAVDASDGAVYASDQTTDDVSIFDAVALPSVTTGPATEQSPRGLTLNGTVNPEGSPVTSCVFEYGTTTAYGQSVQCSPASLGSGANPVAVHVHLENLVPETVYHYRLVAENAVKISSPTTDQEVFTGPRLENEYVDNVTSTSATVHAVIDPNGADTQYYLRYGASEAYGSYAPVSPPGVDLGSAVGVQGISVHLQGMDAGTVHHYRFVVVQDGETFEGPDHSLTTQDADVGAGLADGRAWELVSPPDKKGALIELISGQGGQVQAASDGSGITYLTQGPHVGENPAGKLTYSQVLSRRGPSGWASADLTLPGRLPESGEVALAISHFQFEYRLFSPDLSQALVEPQIAGTPLLSPEASDRTPYIRDNATGDFSPLVTSLNILPGVKIDELTKTESEFELHVLAATPDLEYVIFKTPLALVHPAIDEENVTQGNTNHAQWNIYEWGSGMLQLVNVLPNGRAAHGPLSSTPPVRLAGMTNVNGVGRGDPQRDISNNGDRIAWTWGETGTQQELKEYRGLYVRDLAEERTVAVGGPSAVYQTMSNDGSKIFYRENGDLYVFDYDTGTQTDLTASHGMGETGAGVQEVVSDVSEDGSYVYFVATGVLAAGGIGGEDNLYVLHDTGSGWTTTHIATLSKDDRPSWYAETFNVPYLARVSSRVSPDGRFLAFMSERSLTGYDNVDAVSGQPDEEVYLYDAQEGKLVCASCDPTGSRPHGVFDSEQSELLVDRSGVWTSRESSEVDRHSNHWLAGNIPGWDDLNGNPATYQSRYLSDDGRLFFDSPDGLVAQDVNKLEDVYEYEPEGIGDCTSATASMADVYVKELDGRQVGGCIGLISSGTSLSESAFYDASESGNDVFFITTSKLTDEDYDKGYDVYDAHVCTTTVPCKAAPVLPPPCASGDSCKAAPSPQSSIFGPPPSATFKGNGNLTAPSAVVVKLKSLTNAQKLVRALKTCHKKKGKRRSTCERQARKQFPLGHARKRGATTRQKGRR
jgi:NHL repeat/WD40-like Beta Propeller Repeat